MIIHSKLMKELIELHNIPSEMEKPLTIREKIDMHLKAMASIGTTRGIDSSKEEIEEINKKIDLHLLEIYNIDPLFFTLIEPDELAAFKEKHKIE